MSGEARRDRRPLGERSALGLALLAHGSMLLLAAWTTEPRRDVARSSGVGVHTEIDLEPLPPLRDGAELPAGVVAVEIPPRAAASGAARGGGVAGGDALAVPEGAGESAPPAGVPAPDDYGPPEGGLGGYGMPGGPPVWALPGAVDVPRPAPAPTTPGAPRATDPRIATRVLEGTLAAGDRDKGLELEVGGVVARALEASARQSTLPHDCRASFDVVVSGAGEVLAVRHVSATAGDAATWRAVAERARGSLSARRLAMRGRARNGAHVSVTVVSRYVDVNGAPGAGVMSNASDVIHATYAVRLPGDKPMPAGEVKPVDTSSPFTKALPKGVAPVEHKSLDKGR